MENGKNPGLGIRALHGQGITGEGVSVAIIDEAIFLEPPESFSGRDSFLSIIQFRPSAQ